MRLSTLFSLAVAAFSLPMAWADDKYVVAHFIAGNAAGMSSSDWQSDIAAAQQAHIDGFAMNIAAGDSNTASVLSAAYSAAESAGFKLFLSFDYVSEGAWDAGSVTNLINQYKDSSAQLTYEGKPLVSTFEGVNNWQDWQGIKGATGCFFIPSWTSMGLTTWATHFDVSDGALPWAAWPDGASDMTTGNDMAYMAALAGKPYMMPVSPWFYTNLAQWGKNWLWRGDDLWHDRWQQAIELQPQLVEILTWNDYGESHYIGPLHDSGIPQGANYASGMAHDGWRTMLPHYIDAYKSSNTTISTSMGPDSDDGDTEKISFWYNLMPSTCGSTDGTTGNSPQQGQAVVSPLQVSQDKVFASVLVSEPSDVSIQIGDNSPSSFRALTAGISHFNTGMNGQTGAVKVTVSRNGQQVLQTTGPEITENAPDGNVNFNAYVGSSEDLTGGSPGSSASSSDSSSNSTATR